VSTAARHAAARALLGLLLLAVPLLPAEAAPKKPKPAPTASAPATVGDLAGRKVEVRADGGAVGAGPAQAMRNYRQFLELQNADPKMRAEALRRLADLNLETGELDRMSSEVSAIDLGGAEAIRLYATLLKAYPDYARNDQVLYQLARAYETTGQVELALATLDRIVARFPNARDIAEVQFRRGEILFSARRYKDAQAAYEKVVARGPDGSTFYDQSLYKQGWSLFKQSLNEECLRPFAAVLDRLLLDRRRAGKARAWESLSRPERELSEDTLRVMSIAFSYQEGAKSLDALVAARGVPPYAWLMYSRLGDLYVQKQRYQDAASTYRAFVARDPVDEHAPTLSDQAIAAYSKGGFADLVVEGKAEYVRSYGLQTAFWKGRERRNYPQVVQALKTNLHDLAEYYHAVAQKSKLLPDYANAARWYRDYLASFPDSPDAADTNYLLADALFESHQYADAAAEYEHTAYGFPRNARSAEAGYAALVAYQKQEDALAPAAKPPVHAKATESGVHFATIFPQHPESGGVLTRAAQDVFAAKDLPRAITLAETVLAHEPAVDAAKQRISWTIIGQSQFELGEFAKAEAGFGKALALTPASAPEHADLNERLAAAIYKQGDAHRQAGDQVAAAADFLRVVNLAGGSKVVPTALYDAAAAYINAQKWNEAISALEAYRRDYPKGEYAHDVTTKLAIAYVEAGRGAQAAAEFERIAQLPGEDAAVTREAVQRAADLYAAAGNVDKSRAMLELFVQRFPTPLVDAEEARAKLVEQYGKAGNAERVRYWQAELVRADAAGGAARTERTRTLASAIRLQQATPARDAFRAVRLGSPLKKSLAAKKTAMEAALKGYKDVVEYGVASTTTAATFEMAELYRTLAKDLMGSDRPAKLSADEREQYDSLLEEQAYPFEEQAITIHEVNAVRAAQGFFDEGVRKSFRALAEMKPARYGKTEQFGELQRAIELPAGERVAPDAVAGLTRGVAAALSGNNSEAEIEFKLLEQQYPTLAEASYNLGIVARNAGELDVAADALRRATERAPGRAEDWDQLGLALRLAGRFSEARAAYDRATQLAPDYAPAHRNLAVLLDVYLGDAGAALPEYERYQQLAGESKQLSGWLAEVRRRANPKGPAPAESAAGAGAEAAAGAAAPDQGAKP
jgi:tetratricopeptide (TPR) repeat protein